MRCLRWAWLLIRASACTKHRKALCSKSSCANPRTTDASSSVLIALLVCEMVCSIAVQAILPRAVRANSSTRCATSATATATMVRQAAGGRRPTTERRCGTLTVTVARFVCIGGCNAQTAHPRHQQSRMDAVGRDERSVQMQDCSCTLQATPKPSFGSVMLCGLLCIVLSSLLQPMAAVVVRTCNRC
jgi:hypothetical protein